MWSLNLDPAVCLALCGVYGKLNHLDIYLSTKRKDIVSINVHLRQPTGKEGLFKA